MEQLALNLLQKYIWNTLALIETGDNLLFKTIAMRVNKVIIAISTLEQDLQSQLIDREHSFFMNDVRLIAASLFKDFSELESNTIINLISSINHTVQDPTETNVQTLSKNAYDFIVRTDINKLLVIKMKCLLIAESFSEDEFKVININCKDSVNKLVNIKQDLRNIVSLSSVWYDDLDSKEKGLFISRFKTSKALKRISNVINFM